MSDLLGETKDKPKASNVVYVHILENGYAAALFVSEDAPNFPSQKQIYLDVERAGVVYGIDDSVISAFVEQGIKGKTVVFARGTQAAMGSDAKLFWHENSRTDPISFDITRELEGHTQDLDLFQPVRKDQVILTKIPAQEGGIGINVFGDSVVEFGSDIPIPTGNYTYISKDGHSLMAAKDGIAVVTNGKISVQDIHCVPESGVDHVGNIKYDGSVYFEGDIVSGFRVEALGDIYISGRVEGADVYSRCGSIIIKQGVIGRGRARILAGGRVATKFIQDATVGARIDVIADRYILNSAITAGRHIKISSDESLVSGGTLFANKKIVVGNAGTSANSTTELKVGYTPPEHISRERFQLRENQRKNRLALVSVQKRVAFLTLMKENLGKLTDDREQQLIRWELQEKFLRDKHKEHKEKQIEIEEQGQMPEGNRKEAETIRINYSVHPGVNISIGDSSLTVDKVWNNVVFFRVGDKITIGPKSQTTSNTYPECQN